MSLWSKIKNTLGINRKFFGGEFFLNGEQRELRNFKLIEGVDYTFNDVTGMFTLFSKLEYRAKWKKDGKYKTTTIICEAGFEWNGADIPKPLQSLIGGQFAPEFILASCFHDKAVEEVLDHYIESRIFYAILKTRKGRMDIPKWKEIAMYSGVFLWSIHTDLVKFMKS